jgi:hypothetical protein
MEKPSYYPGLGNAIPTNPTVARLKGRYLEKMIGWRLE